VITQANIDDLRTLAGHMAPRTPMSADMARRLAAELQAGGELGQIIGHHPDANAPLFAVRTLAGMRLLVLTGRAPTLEAHLRGLLSHGDDREFADRTWELFREAALASPAQIAAALARPVQQHHPRRAGMLMRGLGMLAAPQVRLLELGACAGLTLIPDLYRWIGTNGEWGDKRSAVRLPAVEPLPGPVQIVERAGCDLHPLNVRDPDDLLILESFVPHELEIESLELADAARLVASLGITIDRADAIDWLEEKLTVDGASACTVVWHSIFRGYLPPAKQDALEDCLCRAAHRMPLAVISYEPRALCETPRLQVRLYS
jgi:hypothetical protein